MEGKVGNCFFQRKSGHISETVRDKAKVTLFITNRKWLTFFQMTWKSSTLDGQYGRLS